MKRKRLYRVANDRGWNKRRLNKYPVSFIYDPKKIIPYASDTRDNGTEDFLKQTVLWESEAQNDAE